MENLNFIKKLKRLKLPFFSDEDLKLLFTDKPHTTIHNALSYHLKNKNIIKFKRGLYCLPTDDDKYHFSKFSLANNLYSPSYISFETALSCHGLIPEAVYETTSACFQSKRKKFNTPLGVFSYSHIPITPFFLEVKNSKKEKFLMATPIRALFDLIYLRRRFYKSVDDLDSDFRIDLEELETMLEIYKAGDILELGEIYKKKTTRQLAKILIRGFK